MGLDRHPPTVQRARPRVGQHAQMLVHLIGKKTRDHQQTPFRHRNRPPFPPGQIHISQGFHYPQPRFRHSGPDHLVIRALTVAEQPIRLKNVGIRGLEGAGIVKVPKVRGAHRGVLGAVDRSGPGRVHGFGQHALPGTVFHGENGPVLRPGPGYIALKRPALQTAFQAAPAAEGVFPVAPKIGPEIHPRTGEMKLPPHLRLHTPTGQGQTRIAEQGGADVPALQKLLQIVKTGPVQTLLPKRVPQGQTLFQRVLGRRKADEHPVDPVRFPRPGLQRVVQRFPVAGTKAPGRRLCGVHIGEIGRDGARMRHSGTRAGGARQQTPFAPQPDEETPQRLAGAGQRIVQPTQRGSEHQFPQGGETARHGRRPPS